MTFNPDSLYDFWTSSGTEVTPCEKRIAWQHQTAWRETFAKGMHDCTGKWPCMSSKDDMVVLFTKPYVKDFERSINAIERYQAIEQPLEYILFSTSVNEPCFDCSGYLPSVETIREISHFTRDGLSYEILFTLSDSSFSWTMIFLFISKGPYFVWRAENQNSPDV